MEASSKLPSRLRGVDLKSLTYAEADRLLQPLSDEQLLRLFDSPSIKLGDTACGHLSRRGGYRMVIDAIHSRALKTRNGKVRAANFLSGYGRTIPETLDALMVLAEDRNQDAVNTALLPIVMWGDATVLPKLRELYSTRRLDDYRKAVQAIEKNDHRFYSPGFSPDERWMTNAGS